MSNETKTFLICWYDKERELWRAFEYVPNPLFRFQLPSSRWEGHRSNPLLEWWIRFWNFEISSSCAIFTSRRLIWITCTDNANPLPYPANRHQPFLPFRTPPSTHHCYYSQFNATTPLLPQPVLHQNHI